ncbi:MAG: hypothetical protein K940chlam2_01138 [Chlamydiae bacterium]|nr:hypothetical protein [Chlamydiota bacterium]
MEVKPPGAGPVQGAGGVGGPQGPSEELLGLVGKVKEVAHIVPPFPTYSNQVPPGASSVDQFARDNLI